MVVLLGIAFLAGVITAVSPCVLPVLPIVLAGGASGGRRRPYAIVAGLITMFVFSILFASYLLEQLGLPEDLLRNISIALLFAVAATLLFPRLEHAPRARARAAQPPQARSTSTAASCSAARSASPSSPAAARSSRTSRRSPRALDFGFKPFALAVRYALGASVVLLAIALGGQRVAKPLRARATELSAGARRDRRAAAFWLSSSTPTRSFRPRCRTGRTSSRSTPRTPRSRATSSTAKARRSRCRPRSRTCPTTGRRPSLDGGGNWINSPPLTMQKLRGKVVLIDFWTYSCINCLRTLPQLEAWDARYRKDGLVIVGVHTPEFAFEHVTSNVSDAVKRLDVRYPVVQDNDYGIWNAYSNQYWPAEYLIDRSGHVRHAHFGEGEYDADREADPRAARCRPRLDDRRARPDADGCADARVVHRLRARRPLRRQDRRSPTVRRTYHFPPQLPLHHLALGGLWTVLEERGVTGRGARLRVHFQASKVYLVLGGHGKVDVYVERQEAAHRARGGRPALHARGLAARARRAARAALHARDLGLRVHVRLIELGDEREVIRGVGSRRQSHERAAVGARRRSRVAPTDARRGTSSRGRRVERSEAVGEALPRGRARPAGARRSRSAPAPRAAERRSRRRDGPR